MSQAPLDPNVFPESVRNLIAGPVTIKPVPLPGSSSTEFKFNIVNNVVGGILTIVSFFSPVPIWLGPAMIAAGNAMYSWARGKAKS